ncbi:MAG: hypothetical protein HDT47_00510, partial [Ruminococcaceae bacterium]|nr:hypothetical protein [Oscillospiraceae bacterium]
MAEKKFDDVKINVEFSEDRELKELKSGEGLSVLMGKLAKAVKDIISHLSDGVKHISAEDRENWNNHVNLNLLDNADFKINQRGQKTYSELRGTYNVDRWLAHGSAGGSTITVVDDGIEITINTNKTF